MVSLNGIFHFFFLGNCDFNAVSELRCLKARLEELESDLRDRDEEIRNLKSEGNQQKAVNGDDSEVVKVQFRSPDFSRMFYDAAISQEKISNISSLKLHY